MYKSKAFFLIRRRIYVCILEVGKDFLEKLHKLQAIGEKTINVNYIEIFC